MGRQRGEVFGQAVGQRIVASLGCQLGALPAHLFSQLAFSCPAIKQGITGGRLGLTHQPELFSRGKAFSTLAVTQLVLAIEAVQFSEVELGIVVAGEGGPIATLGQPAQPTQLHPVGLGQVAMSGEEFLDLGIARGFQARCQLVVGQVGGQRVIAQCLGVAQVRALVAFGQGALGLVVILALHGDVGGLGDAGRRGREKQAGN
ncbi:hypothetical protein D3C72_1624430 [compost metagenome]